MRRTWTTVALAGCLTLTACIGGDDDATPDVDGTSAEADPSGPSDTADGQGGGDGAASEDPADDAEPPETTIPEFVVTELPGLLDASDAAFPNDPAVRTGVLENGLTYYVRFNDQPGSRASLRLAIDGGAVDELDDVTGVAHYAEHMMFNGTEAYPENELIDVLRSFGADFGPDINAYTAYDETVYQLEVPNDDPSIAEAMNVLGEWLSNATIEPGQVDAERGVILDEWRIRTQTLRGRLFEVAQGLFVAGTPYEGRSPIGTSADIEAMTPETLRAFYDAWYRPDNAAIIVVGDIDVDDVVAQIAERFGAVEPRGEAPPEQVDYSFDLDLEPDFALHVDPDQATVDVEVTLPLPSTPGTGTLARRADLLDEVIYDVLVGRLDRDVAVGAAPFDEIVPGGNSIVSQLDAPALYAFTDAVQVRETLDALLLEYERAYRYGFDQIEIDAAVDAVRAEWDAYLGREFEIQDAGWASRLVAHFLDGDPYPTVRAEFDLIAAELEAVTPEAAWERFKARWTNTAPHVIISTPEASAGDMPSRDEVLAAIEATRTAQLPPREPPRDLPDQLMARPAAIEVPPRRAMTEFFWTQLNPWAYEFPNGATVVLNPNTISQGTVVFEATSPGGSSLVADDDAIDALFAAEVVLRSGIADFNQAEFVQITSSGTAELGAAIEPYRESLRGDTASADAESLFQQIHLYMTQPRFDPIALDQVIQQERPAIVDPSIRPGAASFDVLEELHNGSEPRHAVLPAPEQFDTLDLDGVERVWRDRFGDASDWVFVFSGDFDLREFEQLAASYIGTLPGSRGVETPVKVGTVFPDGVTTGQVRAGSGNTASVEMLFVSPIEAITPRNEALVTMAAAVIDARLTRVVREEFGDSYSPRIISALTIDPDPVVETYIRITGAPDRLDIIAETVIAQIDDITSGGLSEDEYAGAFRPVEEDYSFVNNGEYLRELTREILIPDYDFDAYVFEADTLAAVDRGAVIEFIDRVIPTERYAQVTTTPR